jgi:hypothetical protein
MNSASSTDKVGRLSFMPEEGGFEARMDTLGRAAFTMPAMRSLAGLAMVCEDDACFCLRCSRRKGPWTAPGPVRILHGELRPVEGNAQGRSGVQGPEGL